MEETAKYLYGIAWAILGGIGLVLVTQFITIIKEKWNKGNDLGTALILKEIEILKLQNQSSNDLVKKDLDSITNTLNRYQIHMEKSDTKQSEVDNRLSIIEQNVRETKNKSESNEKLIFDLEKDFLNAGIKSFK